MSACCAAVHQPQYAVPQYTNLEYAVPQYTNLEYAVPQYTNLEYAVPQCVELEHFVPHFAVCVVCANASVHMYILCRDIL